MADQLDTSLGSTEEEPNPFHFARLARHLRAQEMNEAACLCLVQAVESAEEHRLDATSCAGFLLLLAEVTCDMGMYCEAEAALERAEILGEDVSAVTRLAIYRMLARVRSELGKEDAACDAESLAEIVLEGLITHGILPVEISIRDHDASPSPAERISFDRRVAEASPLPIPDDEEVSLMGALGRLWAIERDPDVLKVLHEARRCSGNSLLDCMHVAEVGARAAKAGLVTPLERGVPTTGVALRTYRDRSPTETHFALPVDPEEILARIAGTIIGDELDRDAVPRFRRLVDELNLSRMQVDEIDAWLDRLGSRTDASCSDVVLSQG